MRLPKHVFFTVQREREGKLFFKPFVRYDPLPPFVFLIVARFLRRYKPKRKKTAGNRRRERRKRGRYPMIPRRRSAMPAVEIAASVCASVPTMKCAPTSRPSRNMRL